MSPPPLCPPPPQMADVMDTDELSPEQEADLAAIRARKKQIVTAHRIKKGVANNRCVCVDTVFASVVGWGGGGSTGHALSECDV